MLNSSIALKKYLLFILVLLWQLNIALGLELTVDNLKIEEGWRLEFKDGAILTFRENGNEIKMGWKDLKNDHPWLSSVQVQKKDLTDTDTAAYDRFSKNQNRIAVEKWETWEKKHNLREKIRFEIQNVKIPISMSKDHLLKMILGRFMSFFSSYSEEEIDKGIHELEEKFTNTEEIHFYDHFHFIKIFA